MYRKLAIKMGIKNEKNVYYQTKIFRNLSQNRSFPNKYNII